ncbi:proto-oncogene tyrosine-protein kinase ROS-like isoform X3 [Argopecten irradians]|uniref:proto-oncogene tyrosine-protein kinase ROS-like isoform X3 n=1 Tax=Argopecten irradians TaxID=31199 RepID=UPI003711AF83
MSNIFVFCVPILILWMLQCVYGQSIESACKESCESSLILTSRDKSLFCNDQCKLDQCRFGCEQYNVGLESSCQQACSESLVERQYCMKGCNTALGIYTRNIEATWSSLPAPELKHGSKTHSSLVLHWAGPIHPNVTYYIQSRITDFNSDWEIYNESSLESGGYVNITGLRPYVTYKFKILLVITPAHMNATPESEEITTSPFGAPSSPPYILDVSAPTPSVITISWKAPIFTNGPILGYRLNLDPVNHPSLKQVNREVPGNVTSWTLQQLQSSQLYYVTVSAWNSDGEGPPDSVNVTTPNAGNLTEDRMPYLILGEDNVVLKQNMKEWLYSKPHQLHTEAESLFLSGIGVHIARQALVVSVHSDVVKQVHYVDINEPENLRRDIYPMLTNPTAVTVDWLNDLVYVIDDLRIYQCDIDASSCNTVATGPLSSTATDLEIDPLNGFLYFTQTGDNAGLYRIDTGDIRKLGRYFTKSAYPRLVMYCQLRTFFIDHSNMQLYFPNDSQNTMLTSFLDGSGLVDLRKGKVVRPNYHNITSMVFYNGTFWWTNGDDMMKEDYDVNRDMFYLNPLLFFTHHYTSFNLYLPTSQPPPVPHSPPQNLQALFTSTKVKIKWSEPQKLSYQGKGAWAQWLYEVSITMAETQEETILRGIDGRSLEQMDMLPNKVYTIKARACCKLGCGPWSSQFIGRTLPLAASDATLLFSSWMRRSNGLLEVNMYGKKVKMAIIDSTAKFKDFAWSSTDIYWTANDGGVYTCDRATLGAFSQVDFAGKSVSAIAYDWLGHKLYWSISNLGVIRRSSVDGSSIEFVTQGTAHHMAVDSLAGRLYWSTTNTLESAALNGEDHYLHFSIPFFSGKHVISLTLNMDMGKVLWYVRGYRKQELYMTDLVQNGEDHDPTQPYSFIGSFTSISEMSVLHYYSHRLFWKNSDNKMVVGDMECNHTSDVSSYTADGFTVLHHSLQPYPAGMNESTLIIIPKAVPMETIQCQGHWADFNLTWSPATVTYGKVFYEVSIEVPQTSIKKMLFQKMEDTWYKMPNLPPYSEIIVSLRAYTYWGNGPVTTVTINSPMSVPGKPLQPRVYVNPYKDAVTSHHALAADFRWMKPNVTNGLISQYNVSYWSMSVENGRVFVVTSPASSRHFILDNLLPNASYSFQVCACTVVGCGEKSNIIVAQQDVVRPVPKLLVATPTSIRMAEIDSSVNLTVAIETSVSPVAVTYQAQDNRMFWINGDGMLMESVNKDQNPLVKLNNSGVDLSLDWISRTLFIVEVDRTRGTSTLGAYKLDQREYISLQERPQAIRAIVADPYTSNVIWTEEGLNKNQFTVYKMNSNSDIVAVFSNIRRRLRREVTSLPCTCPMTVTTSGALAVDHSSNNKMEMILYHLSTKSLIAADIDGCHCRTILPGSSVSDSPPDLLSVDHLYIYWYVKASGQLFAIDKATKVISLHSVPGVTDLLAYGSQLQPLPGLGCLDPGPYNGSIVMVYHTNASLTLLLEEISWPAECDSISHPNTRYTVFFKQGSHGDRCGLDGHDCLSQTSYNRQMTVSPLEAYMEYVVHGAVSNYYTENLDSVLSEPHVFRTKVGVPSPATSVTIKVLTFNKMSVKWSPPLHVNGPLEEVTYKVKWSVMTKEGQTQEMEMTPAIELPTSITRVPIHNVTLTDLLPNHQYKVKILASNKERLVYSETAEVKAKTFEGLSDIKLESKSEDTLNVSWDIPGDESVYAVTFIHYQIEEGSLMKRSQTQFPTKAKNYTQCRHSIRHLQPYTQYSIKLKLVLTSLQRVDWPDDDRFVFRTNASTPLEPLPPEVQRLKSHVYVVVWQEPKVNGESISHYLLQYRQTDSDTWEQAYNGTELRWVVDKEVTPPGHDYVFRVKATNEIGWGPPSNASATFTFIEALVKTDNTIILAIGLPVGLILIGIVILIAYCYVRWKRQDLQKKRPQFVAVARGPDVELATLRELPHTAYQQSNTLYAISLIPTDSDIASLPHFRRDQLMLTKFLGSGAFGEVFEGVAKNILSDTSGETKVAVKTLRKSASDHEKEEFLKEAVLMSNFKHEHILSLLGVCLDNDPEFIILELMEGGDLLSFLRACRPSTTNAAFMCITDLVKICVHVARGCKYLEEMHFVHRDLAARNCLVSSKTPAEMVVKIGDFGLARDIYKNDYYRKEGEGLLPVRWMSPEALVDGVFTTQSDIWAFGILIWEVMTFGRQPYPARTNIEVLHFVRSGGQLEQPEGCPEELFQMMRSCWVEAEDRPSFSAILQQLEEFHEKCVSLFADYIVPIRSRTINPDVGGSTCRRQPRERKTRRRTLSHGHDPECKGDNEVLYKKIQHATSFDMPEPRDEVDLEMTYRQIAMQNSACTDYLIPHTQGTPKYLQLIRDPVDRRKSSQGSSRHSSCSSDIYSLNSSLQVALPPLKQYESIHSIDSDLCPDVPYSPVNTIPEGYEFVPYPSHLTRNKMATPDGYAVVNGPPRRVSSSSSHDIPSVHNNQCVSNNLVPTGFSDGTSNNLPNGTGPSDYSLFVGTSAPHTQCIPDSSLPAGYTTVNIPAKTGCPVGTSSSAEVIISYPRASVERGYSSAEARLYYTGTASDLANNLKNKPKAIYPHIALTDSRNYVDCNRNKASYLSQKSDCSHLSPNKLQAYWASNSRIPGVQDTKVPGGRSRGQVYPLSEALVSGYSDVQASLV